MCRNGSSTNEFMKSRPNHYLIVFHWPSEFINYRAEEVQSSLAFRNFWKQLDRDLLLRGSLHLGL